MKIKKLKSVRNIRLPKDDYTLFTVREDSFARVEVWKSYIVDFGLREFIDIPHENVLEYYWSIREQDKFFRPIVKMLLTDFENYKSRYNKMKNDMIDAAKDAGKKKDAKSFKRYMDSSYDFCTYIWGPWASIYYIEPEVSKIFAKDMDVILSLDRPIEYFNMQKDLRKKNFSKMAKKYGYLTIYNPYNPPYCEEDFKYMEKEKIPNFAKNRINFKKFLVKIKDKDLRRKVEVVHHHAYLKTDRVDSWKKGTFYLIPLYQKIADELKISLRESCNMCAEEVIEYLKNGKMPDKRSLKIRAANKFGYIYKKDGIFLVEDAKTLRKAVFKKQDKDKVRGTIAFIGKVEGVAKIVNKKSDLEKIEEGDVLISNYTCPTYTPYMLISSAIVTDDGGLTSHAAIISREYKKPCIVGTKFATKIFKDGDLVEVDAEKGVVRKI